MKKVLFLLILFPNLSFGQHRLTNAILDAEILKKNEPKIIIEEHDKRVVVQLSDSTIISATSDQELLELSILSDFSNYNTFEQIKPLNYKVLSLRPSLSNCDDGTDMNLCSFARHHFLPADFQLPKPLLIFDGVSPFFQRFPDRILIEPADLKIVTFRKVNHSDVPVALLYQEQLRLVVIERNGMLHAERVLFDHFAPKLQFEYGTPDWVDGLFIDYSHKTIKKILNKSAKKRTAIKDGTFSLNHENGNIAISGTFVNGKSDGHWILYDEDGNKIRSRYYLNGLPTGTWEWFDESGNMLYSETYDEQHLLSSSVTNVINPNLVKFSSLTVLRDKENGKTTTTIQQFFPDGTLKFERSYLGSMEHGYSRSYYDNGQLEQEKYFQFGDVDFSKPSVNYSRDGILLKKQWKDGNGQLYVQYKNNKNTRICQQDKAMFNHYCVTINDRGDTLEIDRSSITENNTVHIDEKLKYNYAGDLTEHLIQSDTFNLRATFYNENMPLEYVATHIDSIIQVNDSTTLTYWRQTRITGHIYGVNGFEYMASRIESNFFAYSLRHQFPVTVRIGLCKEYRLYTTDPNIPPVEFLAIEGSYDHEGKKIGSWRQFNELGEVIDIVQY